MVMGEEANPDDAAVGNSAAGLTTLWLCTCHAQFENAGCDGRASAALPNALSCEQKQKQ